VGSGRAQFAFSSQEEVIQSRLAGVPLLAVAAVIQHNTSGFAAPVRAGIKRPKDFEGKRYGGWGSPMEEAIIKALMFADGADPSKVIFVNLGDQDFFTATLRNIDFAWVFEGWTIQEAKGRKVDLDYVRIAQPHSTLDWYTPVLVGNQDWLSRNSTLARGFLQALTRGYEYAITHPTEASNILLQAAPELNPQLVRTSQNFLANQYRASAPRWGQIDKNRWDGFITWMFQNKLIKAIPSGSPWFSNDYLPTPTR
jgi:ABC-type nitrate/sulfonate/bicarbonate transport system substrate-binding protein